jgi:glycosyltransferase involved in cell wall biosynthesis
MKIHVLAIPTKPTGLMDRMEAFSVHAYKYIKHLSPHFEMIHYGLEGSTVDCRHIDVAAHDNNDLEKFNRSAAQAIQKNKSPGDIIACFYGTENQLACDLNSDCQSLEPSIGYRTSCVFAKYKAFTSYAHMHMFYGERNMVNNPSWYDTVIPNPFTISEFDYQSKKHDYYVCMGRVVPEKGIHLAIQATQQLNRKLVIAGPATDLKHLGYDKIPDHVELVGYLEPKKRNELLGRAKALLGLTYYVEPFGNMVIEANLCGTPVITTDWGAFPETVFEGKTGYRVNDFKSLIQAMINVESGVMINPRDCRFWGERFSDEIVHEKHKAYLEKIITNNFYAL